MGLTIREIRLIEVLLRHPEGLTADDLADRLGVRARTAHRDRQPADEFLASHDLTLVRQAGRGINVEGPDAARTRALEASGKMRSEAPAPGGRRASVLGMVLGSDEPIKLRALASRSKVSIGTVGRDLDEAEEWLAAFGGRAGATGGGGG